MKKAVIIIPTYNEKGNIEKLIHVLEEEVFPKITDWQMGILVVDDSSPDGTGEVVQDLQKKYKNLDLISGKKEGLGVAYVRGMTHSIEKLEAEVVFEMDADFFHDPLKVPEFLKRIDQGFDFVIGTRYSDGGSIPKNWSLYRQFLSIVGNFIIRTVLMRFSIHDWTGGYRAIKKEVFLKEKDKLTEFKGYNFQVGFLLSAVHDGFKVAEVPFQATDRVLGRSKIVASETILNTLKFVFLARLKELERFIKFLVVGGTGFIVQLLVQEGSIRTGLALALAVGLSSGISQFTPHSDTVSLANGLGAGIGAEAAIIANFLFNNFWTFQDTHKNSQSNVFVRAVKFNLTSLGAILIQTFAVWLGVKLLGPTVTLAQYAVPTRILILFPTIIFLVIPLNYLIYNTFIWKTKDLKNETHPKA